MYDDRKPTYFCVTQFWEIAKFKFVEKSVPNGVTSNLPTFSIQKNVLRSLMGAAKGIKKESVERFLKISQLVIIVRFK